MALGDGLRNPRRLGPECIPRVQQGDRAGWPLRRPRSYGGDASPNVHRDDRQRSGNEGSVRAGKTIGTVEENFIARLRPGDVFTFAGRDLKFVRVREMTAWVRLANETTSVVPHWTGARLALSPELAAAVRRKLDQARQEIYDGPEMAAVRPILELQRKWSCLPAVDELLIERVKTREGHHLFFYPVEGRLVHEGLAALFAYRLAQLAPITFTLAANDYGFELLSADPARLEEALEAGLGSPRHLLRPLPGTLNAGG